MKSLPPYGSTVRNPSNGVWIYIGPKAWKYAKNTLKHFPARAPLVLPDDELPDSFRWPVKGLDVIVDLFAEQSPERLQLLGRELIYAGALRVVVIGETENLPARLTLFKPMKMKGVA